jgi:hypothetical protein
MTPKILVLACALLAPLSAHAAPTKLAPPQAAAPLAVPTDSDENWKLSKTLMQESLAPMRAAKTYRGAMEMTMTIGAKDKIQNQSLRARTSWRFDEAGDKSGETLLLNGKISRDGKEFAQSLRSIDDGRATFTSYSEPRVWTREAHNARPFFVNLLDTLTNLASRAVEDSVFLTPKVKASVEGGVPVYIVRDEEQATDAGFTMILDGRTRALRSFTFFVPQARIEVKLFDQEFDKAIEPTAFVWKAPAGSREVPPEQVPMKRDAFAIKMETSQETKDTEK